MTMVFTVAFCSSLLILPGFATNLIFESIITNNTGPYTVPTGRVLKITSACVSGVYAYSGAYTYTGRILVWNGTKYGYVCMGTANYTSGYSGNCGNVSLPMWLKAGDQVAYVDDAMWSGVQYIIQ